MRQKRAKSYRKQMLVYNHAFKFREPYQVLVDDQLVMDCYKSHYDLVGGLKRTLQAEVKPMITQCCIQALYSTRIQEAIDIAKNFERRRCNHPPKEARPPAECIQSVVNINGHNKHRYVVASQDVNLRRKLRRVPGVPLVHISRSVMVMEPLSEASRLLNQRWEEDKLLKGLNDPKLAGLRTPEIEDQDQQPPPAKKHKGPKNPNPLSIKKKQKPKVQEADSRDEEDKRRKRRRKHGHGTSERGAAEEVQHKDATNQIKKNQEEAAATSD
ncbi:UTP23 (YOR004W) [Zygosaccharomyces parabailii]|uniref:U three protein 23 n=1 Tax=Zygosaccharomyces bailii (strain CLIB 213 / ATCC 58445 / CBS 680 / BCRC 21525 / NBRC 1098 / NCYC 1416 / NRRL Y-2227) TaxID=1333698 RepID=A0A8J2T6A7_ZYGB2|nr:UTP23 (YOR004W) [Zygosaccharomyces parabailii]CDF89406.1 ZYBA0S04-03532g1_1 [Zygosaccharomyces bailii CLIB 213]CDH13530.1 related to UTP23-Essential nucleolar protein that is a component of the SSU (small subunit) processome involved in 40S ribosomal subunit biogenesis [Zygosaccharomyces bailii ISA1307]SJM85821.1 related to rRNA-processing protein UTP23 [Zygosaccharomyces bailii]